MTRAHICSFSGALGDLPAKLRGNDEAVLAVLREHSVFSVWDASEHETLARTMSRLLDARRIRYDDTMRYPWCRVEVLPATVQCPACEGKGMFVLFLRGCHWRSRPCAHCTGSGWVAAGAQS